MLKYTLLRRLLMQSALLNNTWSMCTAGGWTANNDDTNPWIQTNFDGLKTVSSITTQGRNDSNLWVTSYTVAYSDDAGATWYDVTDSSGNTLKFTANSDRSTHVTNSMPDGVVATNVRLWPVTWNRRIAMRLMVQGCDYVGECRLFVCKQ